jgi:hypothetical protein
MRVEEISESLHGDEAERIITVELAIVSERVGNLGNGSDRLVDLSSHFELLGAMLISGKRQLQR